jgi:hypothetical protein
MGGRTEKKKALNGHRKILKHFIEIKRIAINKETYAI